MLSAAQNLMRQWRSASLGMIFLTTMNLVRVKRASHSATLLAFLFTLFLGVLPSLAEIDPPATSSPSSQMARLGQKAAATTGPLITDTAIPQSPGTANLEVASFMAIREANFSPNWRRVNPGGDFLSLTLPVQLTFGLAPRFEIFAAVQYIHNWAIDVSRPGGERSADFGGLGDSNLTLKYLLLDEKPSTPAIAGIFGVNFPTGHHRRLNPARLGTDQLGAGSYTFTAGFNFFKVVQPALLYANLYYNLSTDATVSGARIHPRDFVTLNVAMEYPLAGRWVFLLELVSTWDAGRLIGPQADQPPKALVSLLPGLEFLATGKWEFTGGVLIDLIGKNEEANVTPVLAAYYNF